ncbi:helix-turn-helix domain-containing protein [Mesorhizobium ciceri]|uniref:helix-turn-helix domain-containing protein n=1 Tax=Mesorhizobium TaxID=68287 RepID=UPI0009DD9600|nr:helix-turn-helix transcriptional regulator [Mesorhizobium ciceri]
MPYETEDIIKVLKSAREAQALSQRGLGARAGVPQSHISKIESGKVDLQLSSLIQLARLLDLEVKLVPKKALPAVDSVVRSTTPQATSKEAASALNKLRQAEIVTQTLRTALPNDSQLNRASTVLRELRSIPIQFQLIDFQALNKALKPFDELRRALARSAALDEDIRRITAAPEVVNKLREATGSLQALRNRLVHAVNVTTAGPKPAYDLEDDNE